MGKIFGISDLPVSTIESTLRGTVYEPPKTYVVKPLIKQNAQNISTKISNANNKNISNYFIKMRNGFGKLMKHFSKKVK